MRHARGDAGVTSSPHRFGGGSLGSGTSFRFLQLILLLVAATAGLSLRTVTDISQSGNEADMGCALAAGANPALGLVRGLIPAEGSSSSASALDACWARYLPNVEWVPFAAVPLLVAAAAGVYLALPWWKTRRARLLAPGAVDPGGDLARDLDELAREAGIAREVRFRVAPAALTPGAAVFGTGRRPVVRLNAGLLVARVNDHDRFRAVVLHELAHIKNRDITVTYATVALWRAFIVLVLLPSVANAAYQLAITEEPSSWHTFSSYHGYQLIITALIAMMMYLVRADVLRTRELHADVTADSWGAKLPAELAGTVRKKARIAEALESPWRNHPGWNARRAVLGSQASLFTVRALPTFATGLVVDLAYNIAGLTQALQPEAVQTAAQLAVAALIVVSAGLAVWRAVAHALAEGGRMPSGWAAGWWLGAGIAAGELVSAGADGGQWFPGHPETVVLLIVVMVVLMAWAAQYARARLTAGGGGFPLAQALIGLIPVWLTLAFVLALWGQDLLLNGWIWSLSRIYQGLGVPLTHPPVLARIYAAMDVLPGASLSLSGLWWAVPLLWLLPVLQMIRGRFSGLPARDRPRLGVPIRAGLAGGLACCAAGLASAAGVSTVRGLGSGDVDLAAYEVWIVITAAAAMTVMAVCLAARRAGAYLLLDTLTACGLIALASTAGAFLQTSVEGCLGPANALFTSHGCAIHPALAAQVVQDCTGYTLGLAPLMGMAMAAAVHGIRQLTGRGAPDDAARPDDISASVTGDAAAPRHRRVLIGLAAAVVGLTCGTTLYASWPRTVPQASPAASVFITPPPPSPQTRQLQIGAWAKYGGADLADRVGKMSGTFGNLLGRLGTASSDSAALRLAQRIVPPACARLQDLATAAGDALPVPAAQGQAIWARAGHALRDGTSACRRFSRAHDPGSLLAADDDVLNAEIEAYMLLNWSVARGQPPGTAPLIEEPGDPQLLTYNGITLRFNAANLTLAAATAAGKAAPGVRLATMDVESCIAAALPGVTVAGGPPENPGWTLLFKDGTRIRAGKTLPARAFDAAPYASPGNVTDFRGAGDCTGGLVAFDIPASERGDPAQILLAPRKVQGTLRWNAVVGAPGSSPIIGTAEPTGPADAWITVTGYAIRPDTSARGGRIATITVQSCGNQVPQTPARAWPRWDLLLADGAQIAPLNSPVSGLKGAPFPLGRETTRSGTSCQTGSIQFGIPATDSSDSLEILYNGPASPSWLLTPATQ